MILALESSCDESAAAIFDPARGMVGEWIHSQMALHERYGGVVPDLATREHLRNFGPLLARVREEVGFKAVTQIAVTNGPGLAACLAIGAAAAKALAVALHVPVLGVNHLHGHAWSPFIEMHAEAPAEFSVQLARVLPHLGLIVSGGNTLLFRLDAGGKITVLASTCDDAAGEALDKGAKLLGLGYPGGPLVEQRATAGSATAFDFPRGNGPRGELDFSFSGLKTSLRYRLEKMPAAEVTARLPDLCASYQAAVVDALARKTRVALERGGFRSLGVSGGVANNLTLRARLATEARRARVDFFAAQPKHTGDNAGMIAFAAWAGDKGVDRDAGLALRVEPNAELGAGS